MNRLRSLKAACGCALLFAGAGVLSAGEASACARAETIFHFSRNYPRGALVAEVRITSAVADEQAEARVLRMIQGPRGVRRLHLRNMPRRAGMCYYPPRPGQHGIIVAVRRGWEGGVPVVFPSIE